MRIRRGKRYHKYVNHYRVVYKFVPPFKVLCDGNFIFSCVKNSIDLRPQLQKILQDQPFLVMTKCIMREVEKLDRTKPWVKECLDMCKNIVKVPCKHPGGILPPAECIKDFVGSRNEAKVFVASNDETLRNYMRDVVATVPLFFLKNAVLIMDSPSDVAKTKFQIKEQLKMEPTKADKRFLKGQKEEVELFLKEERVEAKKLYQAKTRDLLCMGMVKKMAAGPNPLSVRKKAIRKRAQGDKKVKKRRLRKGVRSKRPKEPLI